MSESKFQDSQSSQEGSNSQDLVMNDASEDLKQEKIIDELMSSLDRPEDIVFTKKKGDDRLNQQDIQSHNQLAAETQDDFIESPELKTEKDNYVGISSSDLEEIYSEFEQTIKNPGQKNTHFSNEPKERQLSDTSLENLDDIDASLDTVNKLQDTKSNYAHVEDKMDEQPLKEQELLNSLNTFNTPSNAQKDNEAVTDKEIDSLLEESSDSEEVILDEAVTDKEIDSLLEESSDSEEVILDEAVTDKEIVMVSKGEVDKEAVVELDEIDWDVPDWSLEKDESLDISEPKEDFLADKDESIPLKQDDSDEKPFIEELSDKDDIVQDESDAIKKIEQDILQQVDPEELLEMMPDELENTVDESEATQKEDFLSAEKMKQIQSSLLLLPNELGNTVRQVLIEQKLKSKEIFDLINLLLTNPIQSQSIYRFLAEHQIEVLPINKSAQYASSLDNLLTKKISGRLQFSIWKILLSILLFVFVWLFWIRPYQHVKSLYELGILEIQKGHDYYEVALKKLQKASLNSSYRLDWANRYAKEYIKRGDPTALYYAHRLLLGDDKVNKKWLKKYEQAYRRKKLTNKGIQHEESDLSSGLVPKWLLVSVSQLVNLQEERLQPAVVDMYSKQTQLLIRDLFLERAYWSHYFLRWFDVNSYFEQAIQKGIQPIIEHEKFSTDSLELLGQVYVKWGKLLSSYNKNAAELKLKEAEKIYSQIIQENALNKSTLYGLFHIALIRKDKKLIDQYYQQIVGNYDINLLEIEDVFQVDTLMQYASFYINRFNRSWLRQERNKVAKAVKLLNILLMRGYLFPETYLYLSSYYFKNNDFRRSLESSIKGLLVYRIRQKGWESFQNNLASIADTPERYINFFRGEFNKTIDFIWNNDNIRMSKTQSSLFMQIGSSLFQIAKDLRNHVEYERFEKQEKMKLAYKNFILAIQKDSNNYQSWIGMGNIFYKMLIEKIELPPQHLNDSSVYVLNDFKTELKKIERYYVQALHLLMDQKQDQSNLTHNMFLRFLIQSAGKGNVPNSLLYRLGFIFYNQQRYSMASYAWKTLQTKKQFRFYPQLNLALANAYLKTGKYGESQQQYQKVIELYSARSLSSNNTRNNIKKNRNLLKMVSVYNNLGVAYHLQSQKNKNLKYKALLFYTKAKDYASRIDHKLFVAEPNLNMEKLLNNIMMLKNINVSLKNRKIINPISQKLVSLKPLDHMMMDSIDPFIDRN